MKRENERYVKLGVTLALAGMAVVAFCFLLSRFGWFAAVLGQVLGILTPFFYGGAIA